MQANGLHSSDLRGWVFNPGMLFNAPDKWWGDRGQRDFPHEGIDFCLYQDRAGLVHRVDRQTRIPVMHSGVIRSIFSDYLGQAVVVEHRDPYTGNRPFISIYAHTKPLDGIQPGVSVEEGDIIATIADTRRSKAGIFPHLHYSLGYPKATLPYESFVWNNMRDPHLIALLDPRGTIDRPCLVMDHEVLEVTHPSKRNLD
ncbi:MAG: M23 family metallopeptidase [Desulfosarcina sp.]